MLFKSACSVVIMAVLITACTPGLEVPKPPAATQGDGLLTVTVRTDKHRLLPSHSRIVITVSDTSKADAPSVPLAGDEVILNHSDKSLRVTFPIDKSAIEPCRQEQVCSISVHVVKDDILRFSNDEHIPFTVDQKHVRVRVVQAG